VASVEPSCRGKRPQASGQLLGICIACTRYGGLGIDPAASPGPSGVWQCDNRVEPVARLLPIGEAAKP